MTRRELN